MNTYTLAAIILSLAILIGYVNERYIRVQSNIAIMMSSLFLSLLLLILHHSGLANFANQTELLLLKTNFHSLLMNGMLSFLLFAGALTIDFDALKTHKWEIATLASLGTLSSTLLIGFFLYYLLPLIHLHLPLLYCFLFGALISPTDPIAVISTFNKIGAPKSLIACLGGESLFNDGVGIVIFITIYQLIFNQIPITFENVTIIFLQQTLGGLVFGGLLSGFIWILIKHSKNSETSILLTIMVATGGYSLAQALSISGPIAMVVAGLMIGNKLRRKTNMQHVNIALNLFWRVIDELLNAVLFLLMGFELLVIHHNAEPIRISALVIPLILIVRLMTVSLPMKIFEFRSHFHKYTILLLTWGGLRGGLALALALSLPPSANRDLILAMTYGAVAFSVIIQGLTIKPLTKWTQKKRLA